MQDVVNYEKETKPSVADRVAGSIRRALETTREETITLLRICVTHGVPLEKLLWCCFLNKGFIRHLIFFWETLRFQGFDMDMAF